MVPRKRILAVGTQVETEPADKQTDETIDNKEQPKPKEMKDNLKTVITKLNKPFHSILDVYNSYKTESKKTQD